MCCAFALVLLFNGNGNRVVAAEVQRHQINSDGQYTYLPSPMGPGIAGGVPSNYQLDFGVTGFFSVEYADAAARILDVDLTFVGNQTVQENPPELTLVTADRVEDWLESRQFVQESTTETFALYTDQIFPDFKLFNFSDGTVRLEGGYNATPADGIGVQFRVNALAVPEPSSQLMFCVALLFGGIGRRKHLHARSSRRR
jgi:hypothetical protein